MWLMAENTPEDLEKEAEALREDSKGEEVIEDKGEIETDYWD